MDVKLILHSELISRYYAQTLCLIMWPRAKFHEDLPIDHTPSCELWESDEGCVYKAKAVIRTENGVFNGEYVLRKSKKLYMDDSALATGRAFIEAAYKAGLKKMPWGLLTGVRPAKPLLAAKLAGNDVQNAKDFMTEKYLVSPDKAELCIDIAKKEYLTVKELPEDSVSIYISVPFCPTRCSYCSFVSYAKPNLMALIPEYVEHLCRDINAVANKVKALSLKVVSIYVGGGTPTTLNETELESLCKAITDSFDLTYLREFCIEAGRPDTVTRQKLEIMKKYGVGRISINPQTVHDKTLQTIGRRHSAKQFFDAYALAKEVGFDSINTDIILGLPGENGEEFLESVEKILEISPDNITIHSFCIKKSADLAGVSDSLPDSALLPYQKKAFDEVIKNGYSPYYIYRQKNAVENLENIGFAKAGKEGLYNVVMMEEIHSVIGIGAGASTRLVSKDGSNICRHYAPKYPFEYKDYNICDTVAYIDDFYNNKY